MNPLVTYACVISAGANGLAVLGPDLLEHLECGNLTEAASTAGALTPMAHHPLRHCTAIGQGLILHFRGLKKGPQCFYYGTLKLND